MKIPKKKQMTMGKGMTKSIAVRMTPEDMERLKKVAEDDNKYVADWMRVAIFEAVRKHEFAQVESRPTDDLNVIDEILAEPEEIKA